jgi:hypothetical protein
MFSLTYEFPLIGLAAVQQTVSEDACCWQSGALDRVNSLEFF